MTTARPRQTRPRLKKASVFPPVLGSCCLSSTREPGGAAACPAERPSTLVAIAGDDAGDDAGDGGGSSGCKTGGPASADSFSRFSAEPTTKQTSGLML